MNRRDASGNNLALVCSAKLKVSSPIAMTNWKVAPRYLSARYNSVAFLWDVSAREEEKSR